MSVPYLNRLFQDETLLPSPIECPDPAVLPEFVPSHLGSLLRSVGQSRAHARHTRLILIDWVGGQDGQVVSVNCFFLSHSNSFYQWSELHAWVLHVLGLPGHLQGLNISDAINVLSGVYGYNLGSPGLLKWLNDEQTAAIKHVGFLIVGTL